MARPIQFSTFSRMFGDSREAEDVLESSQRPTGVKRNSRGARIECPKTPPPSEVDLPTDILDEKELPGAQPITPEPQTIPTGATADTPLHQPKSSKRVVRALCKRIEELQQTDGDSEMTEHIFTVPTSSTPRLSDVYNEASDGIIPDNRLTGPLVVGCIPDEESSIQKAITEPESIQEHIVRSWGFNFDDTQHKRKRNLYHVIYMGDHLDFIYADLNCLQVLRWASHIKWRSGTGGKFGGKIHTYDVVAAVTPFNTRKSNYDRDYKTIVRAFYHHLPGNCLCQRLSDRLRCTRCTEGSIKVKLVNTTSYFINVAKYVLSIYSEKQVTLNKSQKIINYLGMSDWDDKSKPNQGTQE